MLIKEIQYTMNLSNDISSCEITSNLFSSSLFFNLLLCSIQFIICIGLLMLTYEQCYNITKNIVNFYF